MTNNNYYEWSERFLNSRASDNIIDDLNIDQSVDIDWDVQQSFSGGIDLSGGSLTDSSQDYLDLTGDGNDVRVGTGQAIEDGSGVQRINIGSSQTGLYDNAGRQIIGAFNGATTDYYAYSDQEFGIRDKEGEFKAVQYDTDPSAGVLRTPNAGITVQASTTLEDGLNLGSDTANNTAEIQALDPGLEFYDLSIKANRINLRANSGLIDLSDNGNGAADLRLATGQAIEDEDGIQRFEINLNNSVIRDEGGQEAIALGAGGNYTYSARANTPWRIYDREGDFDAVKYTTSASEPGTLSLTEADFKVGQFGLDNKSRNDFVTGDFSTKIYRTSGAGSGQFSKAGNTVIQARSDTRRDIILATGDDSVGVAPTLIADQDKDVEIPNGNLRLATGQSIEDGSGTDRLGIKSGFTEINYESGNNAIGMDDGVGFFLRPRANTPLTIDDKNGDFIAIEYTTSSSAPGTLELSNATIDMSNNSINNVAGIDLFGNTNVTFGDQQGKLVWPDQGGGTDPKLYVDPDGELIFEDDEGNLEVITGT